MELKSLTQRGQRYSPFEGLASEWEVDLRDELCGALRSSGYFVSIPCDVTVHVSAEGNVSLCGIVPSYFHKQKAQAAAMAVNGVRSLQNNLNVIKVPCHAGEVQSKSSSNLGTAIRQCENTLR